LSELKSDMRKSGLTERILALMLHTSLTGYWDPAMFRSNSTQRKPFPDIAAC
jgi:beta-phosphoglucomutase-like phosphatase (HAD superfamily)